MRVGDGLAAGDPGQPLVPAVGEPGPAGQDVPAALGVGQVLQRPGEPETNHAIRGDCDGQVAERLVPDPDGLDPPPGSLPLLPPPRLGEPGGSEVVPGLRQTLAAFGHAHVSVVMLGRDARQSSARRD